jgi:non-heme chloroperoxidase
MSTSDTLDAPSTYDPAIIDHDAAQIERANASGKTPVVFLHGLWLLANSWDRWAAAFEKAGYVALTPNWPGDPVSVKEANERPGAFAHTSVGQVADHFSEIVSALYKKPAIVGHSFGGLFAQILAGRGLSAATVAIDPAPFRGVFSLPFSALKSAWPVLGNPANRGRAVPLTFGQFRFSFANAVSEHEAQELYETFAVPAAGLPLFQAATANFNFWTEVKVDVRRPDRGPLLIVSGERDNTVPGTVARAAFRLQRRNPGITEIVEMPNRGHALTIDRGWRSVAETALNFISRSTPQ